MAASPAHSGPVIFGYDGSEASDHALAETAPLLAPRQALVVVVWESGAAYEMVELPSLGPGVAPAPIDVRAAIEVDKAMYEGAQRVAEQGAAKAREAGLEAEALVVADEITVADTLIRLAKERDAPAIVVGARAHGRVSELLLGSTSQGVIRHSPVPSIVVRQAKT